MGEGSDKGFLKGLGGRMISEEKKGKKLWLVRSIERLYRKNIVRGTYTKREARTIQGSKSWESPEHIGGGKQGKKHW